MSRRALVLLLLVPAVALGAKKKKVDPDYELHYREPAPVDLDGVRLKLVDAHSQYEFTRMQLEVTNGTADFVVLDTDAVTVSYPSGERRLDKSKWVLVPPHRDKSPTLGVTGTEMLADGIEVRIGGLHRASVADAAVLATPETRLPLQGNTFQTGPFACELVGQVTQETDKTAAKFKCTYNGTQLGLVTTDALRVRTEKGETFGNVEGAAVEALLPGDSTRVVLRFEIPANVVDMQFATMWVEWGETFREATMTSIEVAPLALEIDPGETAGKN